MNILKTIASISLAAILICPLNSCDEEGERTTTAAPKPTNSAQTTQMNPSYTTTPDTDDTTGNDGSSDPNPDPSVTDEEPATQSPIAQSAEVYTKYDNLVRIEEFVNDRAAFVVYVDGTSYGNTMYGYIDATGKVIVEPQYPLGTSYGGNRYDSAPAFTYNYVKVTDNKNVECILDWNGTVKFAVGKNGVSAIGEISQGYFWVETEEEKVSGNVYTVKYYSATDMKVVATFENIRAVPDNMTVGGYNATFDENGKGILVYSLSKGYWGEKDVMRIDVSDFDSSFKPEIVKLPFDLDTVSEYQNTSSSYYLSSLDNDLGRIAAVVLRNQQGVYFYSTIDEKGNVLMKPQKNISFPSWPGLEYCFGKNLCPAVDNETGLWGYIDPYGKWVIPAQYQSAMPFSKEGYAVVNSVIIIDSTGKTVLAPVGWKNVIVTALEGTYAYNGGNTNNSHRLIFKSDGSFYLMTDMEDQGGDYQIHSSVLTTSDLGITWCHVLDNDDVYYISVIAHTGNLFIDGYLWKKVQ